MPLRVISKGMMHVRYVSKWLASALVCVSLAGPAAASTGGLYTFTPTPSDLGDLSHYHFYRWGVNWNVPDGHEIQSATLTFDNIWDWKVEADSLWVTLLDSAPNGTAGFGLNSKDKGDGNAFEEEIAGGTGALLPGAPWNDPNGGDPSLATDVTFDVPASYFSWMSDGNFGLGIDPDCHYFNDGVSLVIKTAPELPPVLLLAAVPIVGMALRKLRLR